MKTRLYQHGRAEVARESGYCDRQKIICAARQLFDSQGYEPTTLADIADTINLTRNDILRYFRSKGHLLEVVWSE